ncbi:hypothetical protein [Rossellomorea arthrocnemi]|uniref:hypothetical protein n=1 Tax=Rossellomorea arthrocnemi TaxID=2769542 RepID=UPI00191A2B0C|nr:hypothetical protein [Rossellomorea arthrocnemi]
MFKLTTFASVHPDKLGEALKGLHFEQTTKGFEWRLDGHSFLISPFGPKGEFQESYGYRVFFDGLIDGGLYLFEMSMSCFKPNIQAVEFDLVHPNKYQQDWIHEFNKRPSFEPGSLNGIFTKGSIGICCLPVHTVNIQLRKKSKYTKLAEFLREVDLIREEITPIEYDLFNDGGVAV